MQKVTGGGRDGGRGVILPALQVFGFRSGNGDGLLTRRVRVGIAGAK